MTYLDVRQLHKSFARAGGGRERVSVVRELSLSVGRGEMLALLGASGSGKTTLLRCIGGLETPDAGEIAVDGTPIFASQRGVDVAPHKRNMGMVFQSYALWPHMSVADNVAYPLQRRAVAAADARARVRETLELVGCAAYAERFPHQLSGGQQQRVALARALVAEPRLVLFDEPLSNLDANLREQLRFQIRALKRRLGFTGIYVTHDHSEAMFIADRIAILGGGRLLQLGSANELYDAPANLEVADFLGFTNALPGRVATSAEGMRFEAREGMVALDAARVRPDLAHRAAVLKCHPSRVRLADGDGPGLPGRVVDCVRASEGTLQYVVELSPTLAWQCTGEHAQAHSIGSAVRLELPPKHLHLFEAHP